MLVGLGIGAFFIPKVNLQIGSNLSGKQHGLVLFCRDLIGKNYVGF